MDVEFFLMQKCDPDDRRFDLSSVSIATDFVPHFYQNVSLWPCPNDEDEICWRIKAIERIVE